MFISSVFLLVTLCISARDIYFFSWLCLFLHASLDVIWSAISSRYCVISCFCDVTWPRYFWTRLPYFWTRLPYFWARRAPPGSGVKIQKIFFSCHHLCVATCCKLQSFQQNPMPCLAPIYQKIAPPRPLGSVVSGGLLDSWTRFRRLNDSATTREVGRRKSLFFDGQVSLENFHSWNL